MARYHRRTPKNYDGTSPTTHRMNDVLPAVLRQIGEVYQDRPDLLLAAWADVIGEKLAPFTLAVSFQFGVLTVKVKNSTLHSLLSTTEKPKILKSLRQKFPRMTINNIVFRLG